MICRNIKFTQCDVNNLKDEQPDGSPLDPKKSCREDPASDVPPLKISHFNPKKMLKATLKGN